MGVITARSLGEGLRLLQARAGLTREQLAEFASISTGSLSNYCNDVTVPSASVLLRMTGILAERLAVDPAELWVTLAGLLGGDLGPEAWMHPHERVVRRGFEAFSRRDLDGIKATFADDAVYHIPGGEFLGGTYKGIDQIVGLFSKLIDASHEAFDVELHDVVAGEGHTVAITIRRTLGEGPARATRDVTVFRIVGGKIVEAWSHPLDQEVADEFWS